MEGPRTASRTRFRSLVIATLSACAISVPAAPSVRAQASLPPGTLSFVEALMIARKNAPAVHAALARVVIAAAQIDATRAATLPSLSASGTGEAFASNGAIFIPGVITQDVSQQYLSANATLDLRWVMTDFGRTSRATTAAAMTADAARLEARAEELVAAAEAAVAFQMVAYDDDLRAAALVTVEQRTRELETTRALVTGGARSPIDRTRAELALEAAKLDLATAEANAREDAANLASSLSLDPSKVVRVGPAPELAVDADPDRAGAEAVRDNEKIAALRRRADAARARASSARAGRYPLLESRASGGVAYTRGPDLSIASPSELASASVVLNVPLWDPVVSANVRAADGEIDLAEAELAQQTLLVRTEATKAALQVGLAQSLLARAERMAASAGANLVQVEARYAAGFLAPLELLDAQGVDAGARIAVVKARRDVQLAKVRLLAATGRLLTLGADPARGAR